MDDVVYAERVYPAPAAPQGAEADPADPVRGHHEIDLGAYDAPPLPGSPPEPLVPAGWLDSRQPDSGAVFAPMIQRAIGEQIAEQRMIREALAEFDRRLEFVERSMADRLTGLEREYAERIDHFERSVTERMVAFESVLKRVVDRLTGSEERLIAGLEHNDKVVRAQLDALRPTLEAAIERVGEWVEQLDEAGASRMAAVWESVEAAVARVDDTVAKGHQVIEAHLAAVRPTVEAAVMSSVTPELTRALDEMRSTLDDTERKLRRDVNRVAYAVRPGPEPFPGFDPVSPPPVETDAADEAIDPFDALEAPPARVVDDRPSPVRRRQRPLRARGGR